MDLLTLIVINTKASINHSVTKHHSDFFFFYYFQIIQVLTWSWISACNPHTQGYYCAIYIHSEQEGNWGHNTM